MGRYVVTVLLSCGITGITSVIYIVLCCLALVYRFDCVGPQTVPQASNYMLSLIYKQYIQKDNCAGSLYAYDLTQSYSVFVLVAVSLALSTASLVASLALTISAVSVSCSNYLELATYTHMALCVATLIVDITFATHFGLDYGNLTYQLNERIPELPLNYEMDLKRIGAFLLMILTMKGFVAHAINLTLLIMLPYYLKENLQRKYTEDVIHHHSIHSRGVLSAFEQTNYNEDPWQTHHGWTTTLGSGGNVNPGYAPYDGALRSGMWENSPGKRSVERPDPPARTPSTPGRPFTYSEDARLSPSMLRPTPPMPYTPNPDYSPKPRLKSALKSTF